MRFDIEILKAVTVVTMVVSLLVVIITLQFSILPTVRHVAGFLVGFALGMRIFIWVYQKWFDEGG